VSESSESEVTYPLPATPDAPGMARDYILLHGAHLPPDLVADAQLLVSELVTNAVVHGLPEITLSIRMTPPSIGARVLDHGPTLPPTDPTAAPAERTHGRGLFIVATMARSWGVDIDESASGKTVWFELGSPDETASP
jgi:anti-sigma regulatory factor (Ser/Thr protein kinase)